MKRRFLTALTFVCACCMAVAFILMTGITANVAKADTAPVLSETKIMRSVNNDKMLLATGIKNVEAVYEIGYAITASEGEVTTLKAENSRYYQSIVSGDVVWTAENIFGDASYEGIIVWEIEFTTGVSYDIKAYAKYGEITDSGIDISNSITVDGTERECAYYTVTLDKDNGEDNVAMVVAAGTSAEFLYAEANIPAKEGMIFDGWYVGDNKIEATSTVSANVTLKAKYVLDIGKEGELNNSILSLGKNNPYTLKDFEVVLPTVDCSFYLFEMIFMDSTADLTIRLTDTANADNYYDVFLKVEEGFVQQAGQKAGGTKSEYSSGYGLKYNENYYTNYDNPVAGFMGCVVMYNPTAGTISYSAPTSNAVSLDGFSAEKVTITFTSKTNTNIALRYVGDKLNWKETYSTAKESTMASNVMTLYAGAPYTYDKVFNAPTVDCNYYTVQFTPSVDSVVTVRIIDASNEANYIDAVVTKVGTTYSLTILDASGNTVGSTDFASLPANNPMVQWNPGSGTFQISGFTVQFSGFAPTTYKLQFSSNVDCVLTFNYIGDSRPWL